MSELISIIMPVKNATEWLDECIESIINQTHENWELIAIDDHSTDDSLRKMQSWSHQDKRIHSELASGNGIIEALRQAHALSKGEWLTRMDADDIMPAFKLEMLFELLGSDKHTVSTGRVEYFSNASISEGYLDYQRWLNERIERNDHWSWVYRECVLASANWMTHTTNVSLDKSTYPEDYDLVFDWYKQALEIKSTDKVTHMWREHQTRTSKTSENYGQQAFFKLKLTRFLEIDYDPSRPLVILGKNKKSKLVADFLKKRGIRFEQIDLEIVHRLAELDNPQLLMAVYPAKILRDAMKEHLQQLNLVMGQHWWWL